MRILITGSRGYIGYSLYLALKDKYEIVAHTRDLFDLTSSKSTLDYFKGQYFDIVLHCAIVGGSRLKKDNWNVVDDNLTMYYNLLQCKENYGMFINLASGAEINSPESPYGISKRIIANSILQKDGFYNIRIFGVFNEYELDTRFIRANLLRYIGKQSMNIQNKKMTFFYMKDLIKVIEYYIENDQSLLLKDIDCAYSRSISLLEVANLINNLSNYKVHINVENAKIDDYISNKLIPYDIDYIGLEQGILEVYKKMTL